MVPTWVGVVMAISLAIIALPALGVAAATARRRTTDALGLARGGRARRGGAVSRRRPRVDAGHAYLSRRVGARQPPPAPERRRRLGARLPLRLSLRQHRRRHVPR